MPGRTCRSAVFKPGRPIPIHIDVQAPNRKFAYNLSKCEAHWRDEDRVACRGVSVSRVVGREAQERPSARGGKRCGPSITS